MTVPLYNLTDTWNNGATVFTAILMNVTNTASDAASLLMDLQVGSTSQAKISRAGTLTLGSSSNIAHFYAVPSGTGIGTASAPIFGLSGGPGIYFPNLSASFGLALTRSGSFAELVIDQSSIVKLASAVKLGWSSNTDAATSAAQDVVLARDAAGTLAQRNSTNAQTLRVYNTFTDSSNYERGIFDWGTTSNTLTIGTQAAGTGTARDMVLKSAGNVVLQSAGGANVIDFNTGSGGAGVFARLQSSFHLGPVGAVIAWSSTGTVTVGEDLGISRSAAGVLAIGNGTASDSSATIQAKTKAGAPTTGDVPAGTWALIRDTTNLTTAIYYNNAGALQSVALT